jgi:hypothetical protein
LAEVTLSVALEELELDDVPGGVLPASSPGSSTPDEID